MIWFGIFILGVLGLGFLCGFAMGVAAADAGAAVRWFNERQRAEAARRASVEEVRAAWREKHERERAAFEESSKREARPIRAPRVM